VGTNPGSVFVLTADFRDPNSLFLRAIAPKTGETIWQNEFVDQQMFDLLLLTEETVGVASRDPAGVVVFDAGTGRLRFRVKMEPRTLYRDPFLVDGDKVFVVHGNQRFELYDMSSGQRIWETRLPGRRFFRSAIPVPGGIFFTDTQENLLMIDAVDGRIRWSVDPVPNLPLQFQGEAADADRLFVVRQREADRMHMAEARDARTGEILWRADLVPAKSTTPIPIITDRYLLYHLNSYDFSEEAWVSQSVFIDKDSGTVVQRLAPEELLGQFTYSYLRNGFFGLNARGLVAVFGRK
jgi:outer membrane protein assembly factor BamB